MTHAPELDGVSATSAGASVQPKHVGLIEGAAPRSFADACSARVWRVR